jgi:hypothetical protein
MSSVEAQITKSFQLSKGYCEEQSDASLEKGEHVCYLLIMFIKRHENDMLECLCAFLIGSMYIVQRRHSVLSDSTKRSGEDCQHAHHLIILTNLKGEL